MVAASPIDYTERLRSLMQAVQIPSFKVLSQKAGISAWQIQQLRQGKLGQMRLEVLLHLSQALDISLNQLLEEFGISAPASPEANEPVAHGPTVTELQQEYDRLKAQLQQQRHILQQEFQQASLQILESWLTFWPAAASAAQQNPEMPAVKLLPLMRPVEQLIQSWGVEAIAPVGAEVPFNPQQHQLIAGNVQPGEPVRVSHAGYKQGDKLLHRAKVRPAQSIV